MFPIGVEDEITAWPSASTQFTFQQIHEQPHSFAVRIPLIVFLNVQQRVVQVR